MHKVNFHANIIHFFGITKKKGNYISLIFFFKKKQNLLIDKFIYSFSLNNKDNKDNAYSDYLFVLEYADSGTLGDYLKNNFNKLNWNDKLQFAIQISDAVSFIHHKNIVHRDLVKYF